MSALASPEGASTSLETVLRQAGAVFSSRDGWPVPVHYGSAAGELAVCVSAVGLVDRADLAKLEAQAPPQQLDRTIERLAGRAGASGGALQAGGVWWCRATPERAVIVCKRARAAHVQEAFRAESVRHSRLSLRDRSQEWDAIELIGKATSGVLAALGVYGEAGDPRRAAPFSSGTVAGVPVMWLLESDHRALALAPGGGAGVAWRAIEHAGRGFGISCVGIEAASRYLLLERAPV